MKIRIKQFRRLVNEELTTQAAKTVKTASKNPASGFGMPRGESVRFEYNLADQIASLIDDAIEEAISMIDHATIDGRIKKAIQDEISSNPKEADMVRKIDPEGLITKVQDVFKKRYGAEEEFVAGVSRDIVHNIIRSLKK